jgi:hypothetical protein
MIARFNLQVNDLIMCVLVLVWYGEEEGENTNSNFCQSIWVLQTGDSDLILTIFERKLFATN